jgi:hypothetical protein
MSLTATLSCDFIADTCADRVTNVFTDRVPDVIANRVLDTITDRISNTIVDSSSSTSSLARTCSVKYTNGDADERADKAAADRKGPGIRCL